MSYKYIIFSNERKPIRIPIIEIYLENQHYIEFSFSRPVGDAFEYAFI